MSPEPDRDRDGIPDADDRCPDEPEDHEDEDEDEDGCVDRDNDGDGILDAHEFRDGRWTNCDFRVRRDGSIQDCRNAPEDFDGISDLDGCPDLSHCELPAPDATVQVLDSGALGQITGASVEQLAARFHARPGMLVLLSTKGPSCPPRAAPTAAFDELRAQLERHAVPPAHVVVEAAFRRVRCDPPAKPTDEQLPHIELRVWEPACFCVETCRREILCM